MEKLLIITLLTTILSGNLFADFDMADFNPPNHNDYLQAEHESTIELKDGLVKLNLLVDGRKKGKHNVFIKGEEFENIQLTKLTFLGFRTEPVVWNRVEVTFDPSKCLTSKELELVIKCDSSIEASVRITNDKGEVQLDKTMKRVRLDIERKSHLRVRRSWKDSAAPEETITVESAEVSLDIDGEEDGGIFIRRKTVNKNLIIK